MNREEVIWAAGLFDGEGHTGFHRHHESPRRSLVMVVGQDHDQEVLVRFRNAVEIGRLYGPYGVSYQYRVKGFEEVQAVVAILWQWLSGPKKRQASACLKGFLEQPESPKARKSTGRREKT